MKERPILMAADPVRNIRAGRQTQDRRPVKPQPHMVSFGWSWDDGPRKHAGWGQNVNPISLSKFCPYGQPGDRLWVRETFGFVGYAFDENENRVDWIPDRPATPIHELKFGNAYFDGHVIYAADGSFEWNAGDDATINTCSMWKPSIHMPRFVSRITLEITGVRVERLQDISEANAAAEGVERIEIAPGENLGTHPVFGEMRGHPLTSTYKDAFAALWESCYGPGSWNANPWVWVIEFKRLESEVA